VSAVEEFYTPDATLRANHFAPRGGRDALMAGQVRVMARAESTASQRLPVKSM
jgi:hypothetical protein